jgi:excisionase family DNA binding protein
MMKTTHIDPAEGNADQKLSTIKDAIEGLLDSDKAITVTVADEDSMLSPQHAADRLGFSRQHVRRLIEAGELQAQQLPNSTHWKIPFALSWPSRSVVPRQKRERTSIPVRSTSSASAE